MLKSYDTFVNQNKIDEGLGNWIMRGIKKLRGMSEVDNIIKNTETALDAELKKQAGVTLNLAAAEQNEKDKKENPAAKTSGATVTESLISEATVEADATDDVNTGLDANTLKSKMGLIQQKIKLSIDKAKVAIKAKVAELNKKNPSAGLENQANLALMDFEMKCIDKQMELADKTGDKSLKQQLQVARDKKEKEGKQEAELLKTVLNQKTIEVKGKKLSIGKQYQYTKKDGTESTIVIKGKGTDENSVKASFVDEKDGKMVDQNFNIDNVKIGGGDETAKPEIKAGDKFKYYSESNKADINVVIVTVNDDDTLEVKNADKTDAQPFTIHKDKLKPNEPTKEAPKDQTTTK